jgi:2-polyprenyl-3-methyl-5-hydroxy-6-metoxy-1,4-benzoquinol methylase
VTGIDFSKGMLSQAMEKKTELGLNNVKFIEMDMQSIEFPDNHFDAAVCAFGIFFVEDMKKQLTHIAQKIKYGGKIITATFYDNAFSPLVALFLDRLEMYGVNPPTLAWKRVATIEQCTSLFNDAGLHHTKSEQRECGYHLGDASDWWYIIWNGGLRGLVNQLAPDELARFKEEHLAEVQGLSSDKGIWLEMSIIYTIGTKKA